MIIAGEQVARDDARAELERIARDVARTGGHRSRRQGRQWIRGTGLILRTGRDRCDGSSRQCGRRSRTVRCVCWLGPGCRSPRGQAWKTALSAERTISLGSAAPYPACNHIHTNDLRSYLAMLVRALSGDGRPTYLRGPSSPPTADPVPPIFAGPGIGYRDAMSALDAVLPDGVDIVVDAGNTGAAAIHHLPVRRDGRFVVALGMGGMGYSFGAGIGMAFGRRRRAVVIAGDGAFFMHGMELHTALAVSATCHVRTVQQQCPRHVRDPRKTLLRRPIQLQPVRPQPSRQWSGCNVPRSAISRRHGHRRSAPARSGRRWQWTARRWCASSAPPTRSRRLHPFTLRGLC